MNVSIKSVMNTVKSDIQKSFTDLDIKDFNDPRITIDTNVSDNFIDFSQLICDIEETRLRLRYFEQFIKSCYTDINETLYELNSSYRLAHTISDDLESKFVVISGIDWNILDSQCLNKVAVPKDIQQSIETLSNEYTKYYAYLDEIEIINNKLLIPWLDISSNTTLIECIKEVKKDISLLNKKLEEDLYVYYELFSKED